jgi:hypothetical protein
MPDAIGSESAETEVVADGRPALRLCESRPGTSVLIEPDNTDGWIASDLTVDVRE